MAANGYAFAGRAASRSSASTSRTRPTTGSSRPSSRRSRRSSPATRSTGNPGRPVIDEENRDRILAWVKEAVDGGAKLLAGGETDATADPPTLIGDVDLDMQVLLREVFGPVVTLARVEGRRRGDREGQRHRLRPPGGDLHPGHHPAMRAAQALDFGGVTVNEAPTWRADHMPYGGVKESRQHPRGAEVRRPRDDRAAAGGDRLLTVVDDGMRAYYDRRARRSTTTGGSAAASSPTRDRPGWHEEVERLCEVVRGLEPPRPRRGLRHRLSDAAPARRGGRARPEPGDGRGGLGPPAEARVVQGDAVPLPFGDGELDRVFTGHFYGHLLPGERERFLAEARRWPASS